MGCAPLRYDSGCWILRFPGATPIQLTISTDDSPSGFAKADAAVARCGGVGQVTWSTQP